MKYTVGIDLGSTTTKAVVLDEDGGVLGRGITNSPQQLRPRLPGGARARR